MIHLVGYATAGLGLGEVLRRLASFLHRSGYQIAVHDLREAVDDRGRDFRLHQILPIQAFFGSIGLDDPVIYCVNPDQLAVASSRYPTKGKRIGIWFWELERWPDPWIPAFQLVDEVWAPTSFIAHALEGARSKVNWHGKIRYVPLPLIQVEKTQPSAAGIGSDPLPDWWNDWAHGLAHRSYFAFDCHSVFQRKNPLALIEAFRSAFSPWITLPRKLPQPKLLIRALHPERDPKAVKALRDAAKGDERILISTDYLQAHQSARLTAGCDVYCSPHRSEGLGLGIAEAMLAAKPVIATPWSGNLDFCKDSRSGIEFGIHPAYDLIVLGADDYPHGEGARWADPKVDSIAEALWQCWQHPAWAASLGRASARHIKRHFSGDSFASEVKRLSDC